MKKWGNQHRKIIKTKNNKHVSPQAKTNDMPLTRFFMSKSGCVAMAQINTQTQQIKRTDEHGPVKLPSQ